MSFVNPVLPETPQSPLGSTSELIIVPGSSGRSVFLILIGIFTGITGAIASSWKTEAPTSLSSRTCTYVSSGITRAFSTILGSAAYTPETSVQFS